MPPAPDPAPFDSDRAARLQAAFDQAIELPPSARAAWIEAHLDDVDDRAALRALLDADGRDGPLEHPVDERMQFLGHDDPSPAADWLGQRVGAFRLTRLLGEGGMAIVYLGERDAGGFDQQVAVKLLRRGLWSPLEQRLFRREQRALASLSHPNITHLIDGGISEGGTPYLILEYVHGVPITDYAAATGCGDRERLALFVVACRAVAAAHRQLIVHRDLKPANILVDTAGQVKLLDFGIAKLLADDGDVARTEMTVLTPGYAAPEQFAGGSVTTATDVYSLGIVLHELLHGERPAETASERSGRARATAAIEARQRTGRALERDLANILGKALATEPDRRYDSASELADDIERHLEGRPVHAHPPSKWYRTRKFVGRHRLGVAGATAAAVAVLAACAVSIWQAGHARHQSLRANAMHDFIMTAFGQASPGSPREGPPRITEVVQEAIAKARADARMEPGVRIELLTRLGGVLREQGALQEAAQTLEWTLGSAREHLGATDELTLRAELERLRVAVEAQEEDARVRSERLLAAIPREREDLRSLALVQASIVGLRERNFARALADAMRSLELARAQTQPSLVGEALGSVFQARLSGNDLQGALAAGEELLEVQQAAYGPNHWRVATVHDHLSRVLRRLGDLERAEAHARAALAIDDAVLPRDDWRRAGHLNALLMVHRERHDYAAAAEVARETLRISRLAFGEDNTKTLREAANLGSLLMRLDRPDAALPLLRGVADVFRRKSGPHAYESAVARSNAGLALGMSGDVDGGLAELRAAIADFEAMPKPEYDGLAEACERLADLALGRDRIDAAHGMPDCIERALEHLESPDAYWLGRADVLRSELALREGDARTALAHLDRAAVVNASAAPDAVLQIQWWLLRAHAQQQLGDRTSAATSLAEGRRRMNALKNPPGRLRALAALPGTT
ncbi:MAG: serine/threonine protein kinase [Lysobacteraceae bacterium]|nr:MAG: serine/threonine protein kinase [Xanthomonadaceae bacterium]